MALTRYLGTTRGTISQTINALERKGLVERRPSERDKRSVTVEVTEAGQERLAQDPILKLAENVGTALGGRESDARALLENVLAQLVRMNNGRAFGQCRTCAHFRPGGGGSAATPHRCALLDVALSEADSELVCQEHTGTG